MEKNEKEKEWKKEREGGRNWEEILLLLLWYRECLSSSLI